MVVTLAIGFMIGMEALNSAIESIGDAITTQPNEQIRKAKDMTAGMVLIDAVTAWVLARQIFGSKILTALEAGR